MPKEKAVSVSDRIETSDFKLIAESIIDEWKARIERRKDLVKHWDEVDRQLRMEPELSHKLDLSGKKVKDRAWMPEVELPLQAQTLEVLTSDVRRMIFPKNRDFHQARAALTERYVNRFKSAGSPFPGENAAKDDLHAVMSQDNADRLAAAMIAHWHSQYDYAGHVDQINAQAFSKGFGAGRLRKVKRRILGYDARLGGSINQKIPVLVPRDVRKVYLDDNVASVLHEGHSLGPNIIQEKTMDYSDLVAAARAGGSDPNSEDGGYLANEIAKLDPDKDNQITLVELEGDLVVDRDQSSVIVRDVIVTAAIVNSGDSKESAGFIRYRQGEKFSSYQIHQYHIEGPAFAYASSPLLKGMPIAKMAAQAMNRLIESGQLRNSPPVGWDKNDTALALTGGPVIKPYAQWSTADLEAIKVYTEIGGDPSVLFNIFSGLVSLYSDMTGVTPPRLGAQTKSHTTAFAKDVELNQGAVRTVDFVNSILEGPMTRSLGLEYRMGLSTMRGRQTIYIQPWNEFVSITRQHLPEIVRFAAIGAGAPAEDAARNQQMLSSAQLAVQLDQIGQQAGQPPTLDLPALIEQVLTKGGWTDVSNIITTGTGETPVVQDPGAQPGVVSSAPVI